MSNLLNNTALERSPTVANSLMNRERGCLGGNSYQKELSFDIPDFLRSRLKTGKPVAWLDICCGQGRALIETVQLFSDRRTASDLQITGIDLAGMFLEFPAEQDFLRLIEIPFERFPAEGDFDLITSVHGLHYIGDKLAFLEKSVSLLKPDGLFLANLDPANFKFAGRRPAARSIIGKLRKRGFEYAARKHLLICRGKKELKFDLAYLGADDGAGPNYTGQAAVDSFYDQG